MRPCRSLRVLPIIVMLALAACGPAASPEPTSTSAPTPILLPTTTPEPSPTAPPTETPLPAQESKQIVPCQPDPSLTGESPYPAPTGPYQVGVTAFQLVDETRPESRSADPTDLRVVTIYVWYPAEVAGDAAPCSYASTFVREQSDYDELAAWFESDTDLTYQRLGQFSLYAYPDATIAAAQPIYPIVVYSNLGSIPVIYGTQSQELASYGYVAVEIVHSYGYPQVSGAREAADDFPFVIDQLAELGAVVPGNQLAGHLDLDRIGAVGWSDGGVAVVLAASEDDRLKAGITLDGAPADRGFGANTVLKQPFLFVSSRGSVYAVAEGPAYLVKIDGFAHGSHTDLVLWPPDGAAAHLAQLGTLDGLRAIQIVNAYLVAFFDQYLLGIDQPLLDGPSPDFPEVTIESRNTD